MPLFNNLGILTGSIYLYKDGDALASGSKLTISPDFTTTGKYDFIYETSGSTSVKLLTLSSSGQDPRIGIGNENPQTTLDIKEVKDDAVGAEILIRSSRTTKGGEVNDGAGKILFVIDSGSYTDVRSSGSVAIITTELKAINSKAAGGDLIFKVSDTELSDPDPATVLRFSRNTGIISFTNNFATMSAALYVEDNVTSTKAITGDNLSSNSTITAATYVYADNIRIGANTAPTSKGLYVSGNITSSNDLSIRGFPSVSSSLASLASGVGTLQQVTNAGNTTTNPISSSFAGVGFFGTASWAINVVNGGGGGSGGADSAFLTQSTAAVTWSFTHNLGTQYPVITVYDTTGLVIIPQEIDGEDTNNLKIYFPTSQSGYATAVGGTSALTYYSQSLTTASVNLNTITFTKGDSSQFNITVNTGSFTGSLLGTASWAINALTASFVNPLTQSVFISGNLVVTGSTFISGGLSTQYIDFDLTSVPTFQEGRVNWVDDTKTLAIDTDLNGFQIEIGHQNVVRVRNATPNTILRGRAVFISGSSGNRPLIYTASWEADPTSAGTLGLVAADLTTNSNGYVISNGLIREVDTTAYTAGSTLYLSSSGQLTTTVPVAPLHAVRIGKVITSNVSGIIHVDVDNGYEIGELHDVVDTSTNTTHGELLVKSGSVWKNGRQLTGSYGLTGSLNATSFTGSLFGTASWAQSASNAINSQTASFLPIGTYNITASWAQSASNAVNARTASFINDLNQNLSITGAVVLSGSSLPELRVIGETQFTGSVSSLNGFTGSLFGTASWATNALTASYVLNAISSSFASTASYVLNTVSSSFSSTASFTPNAITTASVSLNTITFTKGSGATFNITVDTGSGGGGGSVTINNNVDNYLITATGTANTLNGEVGLQYSGSILINASRSQFGGAAVLNTTHQFRGLSSDINAGFLIQDPDGEDLLKTEGSVANSDSIVTIGDVGGAGNSTKVQVIDVDNQILLTGKVLPNSIQIKNLPTSTAGYYDIGSKIANGWGTVSGPALTAGRVVYYSGSGNWAQAQANVSGSSRGLLGVVTELADQREILLEGVITISGSALFSGSIGQAVYLSAATAGQVTLTPATASNNIVRHIGYVTKNNSNQMYFNPDSTYTVII